MSGNDTGQAAGAPRTLSDIGDILPLLRQPVGLRPYVLIRLAADEIEHLRSVLVKYASHVDDLVNHEGLSWRLPAFTPEELAVLQRAEDTAPAGS